MRGWRSRCPLRQPVPLEGPGIEGVWCAERSEIRSEPISSAECGDLLVVHDHVLGSAGRFRFAVADFHDGGITGVIHFHPIVAGSQK